MAGGLFGQPFVLNEKCVFFSLFCIALFLYRPSYKNGAILYITLFIIFVLAYVLMAWYDYRFNCDTLPLKKGSVGGITSMFKPEHHTDKQKTHDETDKDIELKKIIIYVSHLLFIVPLLAYIVYYKSKVNVMVYPLLGSVAVFTAFYHGIKFSTSFY